MLICKASEGDVEMLFTSVCYSVIYIHHTWKQQCQILGEFWLRIIEKKKKANCIGNIVYGIKYSPSEALLQLSVLEPF